MTTPGTKTKALCVATRCTTVDQFVSTFHRFCGDDQTFFVATMTSRPIGLETAFSIQLADKQPVLRGMCVVLDAWATPDNRYKRPGIRLGIKRLTADSQTVFDRLRAAAKAPVAIPEGTPPSGPPPLPASQPLAVLAESQPLPAVAPPPFAKPGARPPPLPPLVAPRTGLPSVRTAPTPEIKPPPVPAIEVRAPVLAIEARPIEAKPVEARPVEARLVEARPIEAKPAPIEVTRFQVALNVDTIPPPISEVEFKTSQLIPRPRLEPRIISEPSPDDAADLAAPAIIVDRPSAQMIALAPPVEHRTPGSELVLPANPLHNLSDESLEGFVDCTLYEETGNFFHPGTDGPGWSDELADPPVAPLSTRTVPAMPFDEAPELAVRAIGDTESLRVAPPAPPAPPAPDVPEPVYAPRYPTVAFTPPADDAPYPFAPALEYPPHPTYAEPQPWLDHAPPAGDPSLAPDPGFLADTPPPTTRHDPRPVHTGPYPQLDPALYQPYNAISLPSYAAPAPARRSWRRPLVIGATAVAAIGFAFFLASMLRGGKPAPVAGITSHSTAQPAAGSASRAPARPASAPAPAAAPDDPAVAPDDDGEATASAAVVGHGPCRFTVATTPAGSAIRLDDQLVGPSPITIDASCDKHKIDAAHARYQAVSRWVTLAAGKPTEVDLSLPRPTHSVTVTSTPPGAELSIDGHRAGTTPTVVQMMGFATVNLTFAKAGFQTVTRKVYSKVAQDRVAVKLTR